MQITESIIGTTINYDCPGCGAELNSKIELAGEPEVCPSCGAGYVIPGEEDKLRIDSEVERVRVKRAQQESRRRTSQPKPVVRNPKPLMSEAERFELRSEKAQKFVGHAIVAANGALLVGVIVVALVAVGAIAEIEILSWLTLSAGLAIAAFGLSARIGCAIATALFTIEARLRQQ